MKASEFEEFRTFLLQNEANSGLLSLAQAEFPSIPFDTLIAISSQEKSRQLRSDIPRFTRSHLIRQYISRYIAGDEILNLSNDSGLPPCLLCRFQINSNAEENGVVSTARVIEDVQKCVECDQVVSPCVEMVRRVTGLEYEHLLRRRLQKLEIPFQSEEALRAAGFSKTPDIKLEVPIGVCGRIVNWIDSKASFGDEYSHKTQGVQQFQMYVNRFGPGLVIYWFGFIDELNDHSDVLLLDHFPNDNELHCLTRLDVQPQP
ncbi:uncharacterized protein LOC131076795 isoform X2 [Cryptomeria japonica]|uniref:uncharacterized protein LOC131076795 isoform X2 n=1 Tax=Cryptomeria japonica TaxID=3369 RepID=UPI0027DAA4B2|nr:uncharacterized protein LOC131076795 isoform X2 [Cryptomeria japonica]